MTQDYNRARNDALNVIKFYGAAGQVIKKGADGGGLDVNGDPEPATPDVIINGTITPKLQFKSSQIDGTNVIMGDSFIYFHSDTNPEIDMQTTLNGETYRVVDIMSLSSVDNIRVFTRLQLRI